MATITLKAGEAKTIRFTVTDADGDAVDLSAATLTLTVKKRKGDSAEFTKNDAQFDKTQAADGIVDVAISSSDSTRPAQTYIGELKTAFSPTNIDKSADIDFVIQEAVA